MPERVTSLEPPANQLNEEMLIRRARDGEHELSYDLIRPYERRVCAAAFAILRNEAYHQDYAAHHPDNPYIVNDDAPKVTHLRQQFPDLYTGK